MFSFKGKLVANMRSLAKKFPDRVGAALYQEAQVELTEAKERTPVWNPDRPVPRGHAPGTLRASGKVEGPNHSLGGKVWCDITFGGEAEDYALIVHEDLEAHHATGQAKYLESVINESTPYMAERIGKRIQLNQIKVDE